MLHPELNTIFNSKELVSNADFGIIYGIISFYRQIGINPFSQFQGKKWIDLGCGYPDNTDAGYSNQDLYEPDLIRTVGKIIGKQNAIGIDIGENSDSSYNHITHILTPEITSSELRREIEMQSNIALENGDAWIISAKGLVGIRTSRRLVLSGINPKDLQSSIQNWAADLLADMGLLVINFTYFLKKDGELIDLGNCFQAGTNFKNLLNKTS